MGASFAIFEDEEPSKHELGFLNGLGGFIAEDKGMAPVFLLEANYSRTVNIAIAGNSGVGKSLFVNTIRSVKPSDPTWAPVGVTETTQAPTWYEFPGESSVRLWDMEGAGGSCSWDNYAGAIGMRFFDIVLLLCSHRLTDSDVAIVRELETESIPYFFVRTKLDEDIKNNVADLNMTPEETEESIRCDLQLGGITTPYLLNCRAPRKHDFPKLLRDIVIRLEIFERKSTTEAEATKVAEPPQEVEVEVQAVQPEATPEPVAPEARIAPEAEKAAPEKAVPPVLTQVPRAVPSRPSAKAAPRRASEIWPDAPLLWSLPEGKHPEPIEALAANGGHWIHVEDEFIKELNEAEFGSLGAFFMNKALANAEHTWSIRSDGNWEVRIKSPWSNFGSAFTGKSNMMDLIDINSSGEEGPLKFMILGNKKVTGKQRSYIEAGRLVSETAGKAESMIDGSRVAYHARLHRFVVDNAYWLVCELVSDGRYGIRRFRRYPYYRIVNKTQKVVTVKTYPVSALFSAPNVTTTVEPGTSIVDCYRSDETMEQVIFTLPNKQVYTVSQVEPFETLSLKMENFS
uniref:IRG-type G domain-containing protein n=1 Tax=Alexandrium catenella TaxID=2925 RepID=A0A7S1WCU0_ALECA|mmetsp:Transcript_49777/g.133255  ORF Transcript_49777/g.133255 Transcript_49777/m.133255 type:complete len:570 (+) Transcript_49777:71-1780(+)